MCSECLSYVRLNAGHCKLKDGRGGLHYTYVFVTNYLNQNGNEIDLRDVVISKSFHCKLVRKKTFYYFQI